MKAAAFTFLFFAFTGNGITQARPEKQISVAAGAKAVLRVDEAQIKFRLGGRPAVEFPIVNVSTQPLPGSFRLELLDTNDRVESVVTGTFQGNRGTNVEKILWPQDSLARLSALRFGWRRLRYSFAPSPESGVPPAQGIVQMSRVLTGIFQVRVAAASKAKPGNKFPVRVRVDDPATGKPRHGADVELTLTLDDEEETTLKHALQTDFAGYAVYTFDLPKETRAETGTVTARVSRSALNDEAQLEFEIHAKNKITLTTDKPLYQPGQVAHPLHSTRGKAPQSQSHEQRGGEEAARSARHERTVDCSVGDHCWNASG